MIRRRPSRYDDVDDDEPSGKATQTGKKGAPTKTLAPGAPARKGKAAPKKTTAKTAEQANNKQVIRRQAEDSNVDDNDDDHPYESDGDQDGPIRDDAAESDISPEQDELDDDQVLEVSVFV